MDRVYLRQLRAGRDFAVRDGVAANMANFVYLVGDRVARRCVVVDPAWDVDGILGVAAADDVEVVGALVTHWHPDHVGGPLFGHDVEGLLAFRERSGAPIHVHRGDAELVSLVSGLPASELSVRESGDKVLAGDVEIECLHTPGHTAGSQCFRCGAALIAGDTLFLEGCGRLDLPGSDVDAMWDTLTRRLASLPPDTVLYPGHDYGRAPHAPLGEVRRDNYALRVPTLDDWRRTMGRG